MKALLCKNYGNSQNLVFQNIEDPQISDKQVLISVKACGVNFPDNLMIQGKYQFKPSFPFAPGGEVSGIIIAIGKKVTHFSIGARVLALCGWGGFAEQVAVDENRVFHIPDQIDMITAAGTLYNYGTSYYALKQKAAIKPGETILIIGAAGGVGLAAVELAKEMGAIVIACASSDEKLKICKTKGADFIINYKKVNLKEQIREITKNSGVDIVYDPVGGEYAEAALRTMAWNGRYLIIGFASGQIPQLPFNLPLLKGCSIIGIFWGSFAEKEPQENLKNMGELVQWLISGKIKPHIFKIYPLENAADALQDLQDQKVIGKAIIKLGNWIEPKLIDTSNKLKSDIDQEEILLPVVKFKNKFELKKNIGRELGKTNWLTISQERINQFAGATLDFQWIHIDPEKAKTFLPGGNTIAHGYLTMSLVSYFVYQLISIENVNSLLNYGIDKARFISPVPVESIIRMSASISNVEELPNGSIKLFLHCIIEIKGQEKPAFVAEIISMVF